MFWKPRIQTGKDVEEATDDGERDGDDGAGALEDGLALAGGHDFVLAQLAVVTPEHHRLHLTAFLCDVI